MIWEQFLLLLVFIFAPVKVSIVAAILYLIIKVAVFKFYSPGKLRTSSQKCLCRLILLSSSFYRR